jgi:hypothetical protein
MWNVDHLMAPFLEALADGVIGWRTNEEQLHGSRRKGAWPSYGDDLLERSLLTGSMCSSWLCIPLPLEA